MRDYFYIAKIYISLAIQAYGLKTWITRKLIKELNLVIKDSNYSLSKSIEKRINLYVVTSSLTSRWFCTLRGHKANTNEKKFILYLSAIIPLIDDLTDSLKIESINLIENLKGNDDSLHPTIPVIRFLYFKLMNNCSQDFGELFHKALLAQDDSINQLNDIQLDNEVLKKITLEKGGLALLLFRHILANPLKKGEEKAIYDLGYILQILNDMFDVYKDHKNKQQTLYTNTKDLNKNLKDFNDSLNQLTTAFLSMDYNQQNVIKCLCEMSTFTSRGKVCIAQLLDCQTKTDGEFRIELYERSQLICDMEKPSNLFKSFLYSYKYYLQIK